MADDDDLWSFKPRHAPRPLSSSSSESDGDDDFRRHLPEAKRRKLMRLGAPLRPIDLDAEESESSRSQSEEPQAVEPPVTSAASPDFELKPPPPSQRRKSEAQDAEMQRLLDANKHAMEELERAGQEQPIDLLSSEEDEPPPLQPEAASPPPEPSGDEPKVLLICDTQQHGKVTLSMRPTDVLEKLFNRFRRHAEEQGWIQAGAQVLFEFDGDRLTGRETPQSLELEDEDKLEVKF